MAMGIHEVLTAPGSPWQTAYMERFIGRFHDNASIMYCLLSIESAPRAAGLSSLLRTITNPLALAKDTPIPRPIMGDGVVIAIPEIGGLHHRYERRAA